MLGGTGLIGSAIVAEYLRVGAKVTVVARRPPAPGTAWASEVRVVEGDVGSPEVLATALEGAAHVVHAVGAPPPGALGDDLLAHQRHTVPALVGLLTELRRRPGVGLTYLSSGGTVYGNARRLPVSERHPCRPVSAYGMTKVTAEHLIGWHVRRYGLRALVLRVANAYGPGAVRWKDHGAVAQFVASASSGAMVTLFGDGGGLRDYVAADDVAWAAVRLAAGPHPTGTVNVGTGIGHSTVDLLHLVEAVTGRRLALRRVPARPFDVGSVYLDVSRLGRRVPWRPTPLERGIERLWEALPGRPESVAPSA